MYAHSLLFYSGLILASQASGANFDLRILKGRGIKVMIFAFCNFFITFGVAYATTLILPSGSSWRGELSNESSFYVYYACLLTATSLPMTFLILDDLGIKNDLGKFVIGTSTIATILLFTLMSVGESMISLNPIFGNGLIPFRIGMLLLLIAVQASIQWFWNRGLALEASKEVKNDKNWYARTSTDQSILIVCYGLGCACISERLGYTPVLGAYLAGVFLPYDDHIRHAFQKLIKWMARWILLPMFFYDVGMHFDIRHLAALDWGFIVMHFVIFFSTKVLMAPISKYFLGFSWNDSFFMASIANCRGFNALIVGSVANGFGQFGPALYAMSVLFSIISSICAAVGCKVFYYRCQCSYSSSVCNTSAHLPTCREIARLKDIGVFEQQLQEEVEKVTIAPHASSCSEDLCAHFINVMFQAHLAAQEFGHLTIRPFYKYVLARFNLLNFNPRNIC